MNAPSDGLFEFFLIVTPGFEAVAASELKEWLPEATPEIERGGLTVRLSLLQGLCLNQKMKTVTRILLRVADFGCRDFPKLFKKMTSFPWEEWIPNELAIEVHASSHRSRLFVKKRIAQTVLDGRAARLKKQGLLQGSGKKGAVQPSNVSKASAAHIFRDQSKALPALPIGQSPPSRLKHS
jgi:23S rRNA G2445 N2-methylase RlmL